MKEIKFLHNEICTIADLHIGVHQASQAWHKIVLDFAKWLRAELRKAGIRDILISGDILHDRNEISVATIHVLAKFFTILKEFNIIALVGNHDAYYKDRIDVNSVDILSDWVNIHVVNKITTIESFGKTITFAPWLANIEEIPKSDLVFGHFEIVSFKMNKSVICSHGIEAADLLKKSKLVMSGHFHFRDERKYKDGTIVYLGSPYQLDFGDSNTTKGITILDLKTLQYNFIENTASPKHIKYRLSEMLNKETGIIQTIKAQTPGNFVDFIVDKEIGVEKINVLVNRLAALQPIYIRTNFADFNKFNVDESTFEYAGVDIPTAIEEFISMLDIENKQEILNETLLLYKQAI